MKFLVESSPPAEVKNAFEKDPELQKKVGRWLEDVKPEAAWFTLSGRRGIFVFEANSQEELARKIGPWFQLFKTDATISPAISAQEFARIPAILGEAASKY